MNFSIVAGTTGSFATDLNPPNGSMVGVPKYTASDPAIVLVPAADGSSCDAQVPAGQTANFDLQIDAVSSDPAIGAVTNKHTITVTQPVPPALQSIDFHQTAG